MSCFVVIIIITASTFLFVNYVAFERCASILPQEVFEGELPINCQQSSVENLVVIAKENISCKLIPNETYDLRIIVLTFNRPTSLLEILHSLTSLEVDGDSVLLEIWIDKSKDGELDAKTFNYARSFRWKQGPVHVYVQDKHEGIIGQWIYSWRPKLKANTNYSKFPGRDSPGSDDYEIGLILEDDLTVSPYAYRWLKAARHHFRKTSNLAGITLQSEGLIVAENGRPFDPDPRVTGPSFLYKLVGSWGFAPNPENWVKFQEWFRNNKGEVQPYVANILMTRWYKNFEKRHVSDTMWTMWFIYFCHLNNFNTVYSNLVRNDQFYSQPSTFRPNQTTTRIERPAKRSRACLVLNRREPGLHFSTKVKLNQSCINWSWRAEFVAFKKNQTVFDFRGKPSSPS